MSDLDLGGARALLCLAESSRDPDLAWFVGDVHLGASLLVQPARGEALLVYLTEMERGEAAATGLPHAGPDELGLEALRREGAAADELLAAAARLALRRCGLAPGELALAGRPAAGEALAVCRALEAEGWTLRPGHDALRLARKRKRRGEVVLARAAAAGAVEAMRAVAATLASAEVAGGALRHEGRPLTAGDLRRRVAAALAARGLEQPEGNIVAAGAEAGVPHSRGGSERVLEAGQALVVDLFPRSGLFSDCSRTFCVGEPPAALAAAHAAVRGALAAAAEGARAGITGWELQETVCAFLGAAGYRTPLSHPGTTRGYVHGAGHGVGLELHELPSFRRAAGAGGILEVGDLFTLEPGLYDPDAGWGVRLEDCLHLGSEGLECLTPMPYDLDPRAWREASGGCG